MLSKELQIGKAAEHFVACDLILKGHNAFLADQGLPFDLVIVSGAGGICRVQVKGTTKYTKKGERCTNPFYRWSLRRARGGTRYVSADECAAVAFVALDIMSIGYMDISALVSAQHGGMVSCVDMYTRERPPLGRLYSTGKRRSPGRAKFIEDFATFRFPE